jgi:hypothetical protein
MQAAFFLPALPVSAPFPVASSEVLAGVRRKVRPFVAQRRCALTRVYLRQEGKDCEHHQNDTDDYPCQEIAPRQQRE